MTDADLITMLRTRVAYHEREAERCRRMLALAEDDGSGTPAPGRGSRGGKREAGSGKGKAGRVSSAARPTEGKRAAHRAAATAKLQALLAKEPDLKTSVAAKRIGLGFSLTSELLGQLRAAGK